MPNKSWPIWVGGIAILAIVVAVGSRLLPFGPGPTKTNFERLRLGMTTEEVEAIMGPPTEDREVNPAIIFAPPGMKPEDFVRFKVWEGRSGNMFFGHFDKAGRLMSKNFGNVYD